jgi:hypothetical protein
MISFNHTRKYILHLLVINVLLLSTIYLISSVLNLNLNLNLNEALILAAVFSGISLVTLLVFFKGQSKEPDSQTLYILVAISLKFLLELVFTLIWFIVAKKSSFTSVLMFFVLYLTLTLFTIWVILKTLKNKVL